MQGTTGWEDFGQKVDLTARIRELLNDYPAGTAILSELLQNADDAKAREFKLCLDHRTHGMDSLPSAKLQQFQGPALLAYNSACFTARDFESIQRIGDSLKKESTDGGHTGRFGVGWNSVYHVTDLPSFVSSSKWCAFDPQAAYLPNVNPANPGKIVDHTDPAGKLLVEKFADHFAPFECFGWVPGRHYEGTLFRLPLRTPEQAKRSRLSVHSIGALEARQLLASFALMSNEMLLFLKHVETIELLEWKEGDVEPHVIHRTRLVNAGSELRRSRSFMLEALRGGREESGKIFDVVTKCDYEMELISEALEASNASSMRERWLICCQLGGGRASRIASSPEMARMRLIPWGGVAALISSDPPKPSGWRQRGRAYCFLPLPVHTGLPVSLNGYFELSTNRRDVWQGDGMAGDGALRAQWNVALLEDVASTCYARLMQTASTKLGHGSRYDALWPNKECSGLWSHALLASLSLFRNLPLLHCAGGVGSWVSPCSAVLMMPDTSEGDEAPVDPAHLLRLLQDEGIPAVRCEDAVARLLLSTGCAENVASPAFVRSYYAHVGLRSKVISATPDARQSVLTLFRYCVRGIAKDGGYKSLLNCPFLPLANGQHAVIKALPSVDPLHLKQLRSMGFSEGQSLAALRREKDLQPAIDRLFGSPGSSGSAELASSDLLPFLLCSAEEADIFEGASMRLISVQEVATVDGHDGPILRVLRSPGFQAALNVTTLGPEFLPDLLALVFAQRFSHCRVVKSQAPHEYTWEPQEGPDLPWYRNLWAYLARACPGPQGLAPFSEGLPLVPTNERVVCALSRQAALIDARCLHPSIQAVLVRAGARTLHTEVFSAFPTHLHQFVRSGDRAGLLDCLATIGRNHGALGVSGALSDAGPLSDEECSHLRALLSREAPDDMTEEEVATAAALPIIPVFTDGAKLFDTYDKGTVPCPAELEKACAAGGHAAASNGLYVILESSRPHALFNSNAAEAMAAAEGQDCFMVSQSVVRYAPKFKSIESFSADDEPLRDPNVYGQKTELLLMLRLGVRPLSRSQLYEVIVLPRLSIMPEELRDACLLNLLLELPNFVGKCLSLRTQLCDSSFLPRSKGLPRARPSELYDPTDTELAGLLPSESFPAGRYALPGALISLRQLGLRTRLGWEGIVDVATSIDNLGRSGEAKEAVGRGQKLLRFMDVHAPSLWPADSKPAAGFLQAVTKLVYDDGSEEQRINAERQRLQYISQLMRLAWVPVLVDLPSPLLPPHPEQGSSLVPPSSARPSSDCWLCSSSLYVLDDGQQPPSSSKLLSIFGWDQPLDAVVVARQITALASKFAAVTNSAEETPAEEARQMMAAVVPRLYQLLNERVGSGMRGIGVLGQDELIKEILSAQPWLWVGDGFVAADQVAFSSPANASPYLHAVPPDLACFGALLRKFGVRDSFGPSDFCGVLRRMAQESGCHPMPSAQVDLAVSLVQIVSDAAFRVEDWEVYCPDANGVMAVSSDLVYDDAPWLTKQQGGSSSAQKLRLVHQKISAVVGEKVGVQSLRLRLVHTTQDTLDFGLGVEGEAFGQQESLTRRLRHILALYPEGPSILSELVQNADDAGASVVKIMFSNECHGISSLLGPKMAAWQGPALYVFNDAEFTAQDFRNLTRVGQGSKLDKLTTTGRFGLGFNSVYHMTDVPSFVTGEHLVVFDPNTKYLPGARAHQPGVRVKFVGGHLLEQFPDQFSSYLHFGCDMTKYFKGTLFRFPLRTPAAAAESEISSTAYAPSDIETLLSAFREVAINFLLFLRNVQTIEVHEAVPGGGTSLKFSVSVTARTSRQEEAMSDFIVGNHSHPISKEAFYSKLIQTPLNRLPRVTQHLTVAFRGSEDGSSTIDEDSFLVCAGIGGGGARDFACDERHRHLKFMPWGGVAAHIGRNGALSSPLPPLKGNAFCFLPLPVLTGMPVHINALFELSSNRRDIWFGEDMAGEGQMRSQWNRLLLEDVIAPFYADLVESASRLLPSPSSNPSLELLPGVKGQQTAQPWALIMPNLFKELRGRPIIYTPVGGGTWLSPGQCVAVPLDSSHCDDAEILYRILVEEGLPAVKIPSAYVKNLASQEFLGNIASPAFIRSHFKTNATHPCLSGSNARENALFLFEFAVSDLLQPSGSNADMSRKMEELLGLPFLLLANGALARIDPLGEMSRFICTALEHALFSTLGAGKYIVADLSTMAGIPPRILTDSTFQSVSSVRTMRPGDAAELLGAVLPPAWGGLSQVAWDPAASADVRPRQPSEDWIRLLWEYICTGPQDFEVFEGNWPILPAVGGEGADSLRVLLRLEKGMPVIRPVSVKLSGEVCNVLARLGVWLLDAEALGKLQTSPAILKYVNTCSTEGVLLALLSAFYGPTAAAAVCSGSSQEEVALQANVVVARFRALSAAERDVLRRDVLVLQNTGAPLHAPLVWLITQLPVFPVHGGGSRRLPLCSGLRLAPASAPQHLLDSSFLDLDETELPLCAIAGTQRMDSQAFYRDFLLPGTLQGKLVESSTLYLLSHLRHIQDVAPDVTDNLRTAAIIRPDGADGTSLCCASALYDPSKPNLRAVLGAEAFPHPSLCESEDTLTALRLLGLKISIDAPGILLAARSIAGADALLALSTRLQRSQQLLRMLDAGIERILDQLAQSGDEGALSYIKPPVALVSSHAPEAQEGKDELSEVAAEELSSGEPHSVVIEDPETVSRPACEFVNTLVSIPWLARLTSPPDPLMPWCDADAFGPPLAVRPQDDAWLCSSQLGIAKAEVANEVLKRVFGWEAPISGLVAARQLVALSEQFADISSQPAQAAVMRQSLTSIIPRIYQRLDASENFEPVKAALQGARWIFVGDQFISADCVAFQCPSNTRPYLHQVPPDLACFPRLLGKEGFSIRDTFSPADYVGVLADLHAGHGPKTSLNAAELDLANAMVRLLAKLSAEEKGQLHQGQTIYAPGEDGVLYAACDLVYDDAPWLRASLQGRGRLNYVHADIATSTAAAIGVRSLREVLLSQQASTQSIPCPSSASLRRLLWAASVPNDTSPARIDGPHTSSEVAGKARMDRAWLCDVLEVAEELAMADGPETTVSARVIVDASVYGTQRLLQPALAEAQGPAVCVALDGLALSGENLMRFLALRSDDRVRGAVSVDRSARDKRQEFPRMGTGLAGLFHVTDILQVLTVSNGLAQFYILDPTGRHSILEKSSPTSQSVAKRYTVTRAEVLERFPDQFAPFLAVPGSLMNAALMSGRGSATVIRLPLRSSPGAVSFTTWNVRGAEHAVRAFFDTARSSFLFTSRLNLVEACVRRSDSDTTPVSLFSVRSHDPLGNRTVRAAMKCNRDWRRKGLSNMLKGYYAKRSSFELRIMCQVEDHIFADVWLISSILAPPAARDVANSERYQDKHLAPLLSCAAHIAREHAGSAQRIIPPPTIGGLFVGGDSLLRTGLPVHIDGPFFTSLKAAGSAAQRCGLRRRQLILGPHQDTEVGAGPSRQLACWEWNRHMIRSLCTDLLPDALADVANSPALPAAPAVYRFWPVVSRLRPPFSGLVPPDMHAKLASLPLYLSVDGRFVKIQEGLFKNQVISPAVEKFVGQHFPLFRCPHAVTVDLGARGFAPRHLTPQALRAFLRRYSGSELTASTTLAIEVLAFCLADALPPTEGTPATAGSEQSGETSHAAMDVAGERWRELGGVALLPLASGGVGRFTATGTSPFFVATSEQHILLPHIRSRLVSPHAIKRLGTWFENEHFLNVMGITRLSTKEVAAAACEALPRAWKRAKFVAWTDGGPSGAGSSNRAGDTPPPPSPEWIAQIWRQIPLSDEGALSVLREWPLLPLSTGELASCSLLGNIFAACPSESSQRISQRIQSAIAAQSRELEALDVREEARVRAERRSEGTSRLSQADFDLLSGAGDAETETRGSDSESDIDAPRALTPPACSTTDATVSGQTDVEESSVLSDSTSAGTYVTNSAEGPAAASLSVPPPHVAGATPAPPPIPLLPNESPRLKQLRSLMHLVHAPVLEMAYFPASSHGTIVTHEMEAAARSALHCLHAVSGFSRLQWESLTDEEMDALLSILVKPNGDFGAPAPPHALSDVIKLRSLPIWRTMSGQRVSLVESDFCILRPADAHCLGGNIPLPLSALDRVLHVAPGLEDLMTNMQVEPLGTSGMISRFALPEYSSMSSEDQNRLLLHIRDNWATLREDDALKAALGQVAFVSTGSSGTLAKPGTLLDPRQPVMAAVFEDELEAFPQGEFGEAEWLDVLADVGLRSAIDKSMFLTCAQKIQSMKADPLPPDVAAKARLLLVFLSKNWDAEFWSADFLLSISSIRFVRVEAPGGRGLQLVRFCDAAVPRDEHLCFSVMPVHSADTVPPQIMWSKLNISTPPSTDVVLRHIRVLSEAPGFEGWTHRERPERVFQSIYGFLDENWAKLSSREQADLRNIPIVPVCGRLVKASRLFFRLKVDLAPLFFELPRSYGAFDTLFKALGTTSSPTHQDYMNLLQELHEECRNQVLNPNEVAATVKIVALLAESLEASGMCLTDHVQGIFVPDHGALLVPHRSCLYDDAPWLHGRVDSLRMQFAHPHIPEKVCHRLSIENASAAVVERLELGYEPEAVSGFEQEEASLSHNINSPEFAWGLSCLSAYYGIVISQEEVSGRLRGYQIMYVRDIRSRFLRTRPSGELRGQLTGLSGEEDVTLRPSGVTGSLFYVQDQAKKILVAKSALPSGLSPFLVCASALSAMMSLPAQASASLLALLSASPAQVTGILSALRISGESIVLSQMASRGRPGMELLPVDRDLLQLRPTGAYELHEIVAWEDPRGALRYGVVQDNGTEGRDGASHAGANSITLQQLRIKTGPGAKDTLLLTSSSVYSFRHARAASRDASLQRGSRRIAQAIARDSSENQPNEATAEISPTSQHLQPEMLIEAVNDILGRCGISLTADQSQLVVQAARSSDEAVRLKDTLREAQDQVTLLQSQLEALNSAWQCQICFTSDVQHVLTCGHMICSGCLPALRRQCPFCRKRFTEVGNVSKPSSA